MRNKKQCYLAKFQKMFHSQGICKWVNTYFAQAKVFFFGSARTVFFRSDSPEDDKLCRDFIYWNNYVPGNSITFGPCHHENLVF